MVRDCIEPLRLTSSSSSPSAAALEGELLERITRGGGASPGNGLFEGDPEEDAAGCESINLLGSLLLASLAAAGLCVVCDGDALGAAVVVMVGVVTGEILGWLCTDEEACEVDKEVTAGWEVEATSHPSDLLGFAARDSASSPPPIRGWSKAVAAAAAARLKSGGKSTSAPAALEAVVGAALGSEEVAGAEEATDVPVPCGVGLVMSKELLLWKMSDRRTPMLPCGCFLAPAMELVPLLDALAGVHALARQAASNSSTSSSEKPPSSSSSPRTLR